jgi:hypothetical protein
MVRRLGTRSELRLTTSGVLRGTGEQFVQSVRSRKSLSQSRTAGGILWETCPAIPVIRSRERVRGCSAHDPRRPIEVSRPVNRNMVHTPGPPSRWEERSRAL